MPSKGLIQATDFQALLQTLGVNPNNIPFDLRSEVTPVVLVGGTVSFIAAPTPAYRVTEIFTAGITTGPAAGTVLADTGPLPLGPYSVLIIFDSEETNNFEFQWRNAGNTANLVAQTFRTPTLGQGQGFAVIPIRLNIENNDERFRVVNLLIGGAGLDYQATIFAQI